MLNSSFTFCKIILRVASRTLFLLFYFDCWTYFLQTYIEPGTGQRFRSLRAVERYLTEGNENTPLKVLMPANESSVCSFTITD